MYIVGHIRGQSDPEASDPDIASLSAAEDTTLNSSDPPYTIVIRTDREIAPMAQEWLLRVDVQILSTQTRTLTHSLAE